MRSGLLLAAPIREAKRERSVWRFPAMRHARTIRHLRPRQVAFQVLRRLRRASVGSASGVAPAPSPPPKWPVRVTFPVPACDPANDEGTVLSGVLQFHSRRESVGFPPAWNRTDLPRSWLYHLHSHEFLWRLTFERARETALDWIVCYPSRPGPGRLGALSDVAAYRRLVHIFLRPPDARAWFRKGYALLRRELPEQILPDGGHVERSPMYQCRVLHVLLVLLATGVPELRALVLPRLASVVTALTSLTHPDGGIALLNDSAFGIYPDPERLTREAGMAPAGSGVFALAAPAGTTAPARARVTTSSATPVGGPAALPSGLPPGRSRRPDLHGRLPGGRARLDWSGWQTVVHEESFYCPRFGVVERNPCLAFATVAASARGTLRLFPI